MLVSKREALDVDGNGDGAHYNKCLENKIKVRLNIEFVWMFRSLRYGRDSAYRRSAAHLQALEYTKKDGIFFRNDLP